MKLKYVFSKGKSIKYKNEKEKKEREENNFLVKSSLSINHQKYYGYQRSVYNIGHR